MNRIKSYFRNWDAMRIFRLIMSIILGLGYYNTGETLFLLASVFLLVQAILNISCPGGSCGTTPTKQDKTAYKFKKYEPKKQ